MYVTRVCPAAGRTRRLLSALVALAVWTASAPPASAASLAEDGVVPAFLIDRERRSPTGCDGAPSTPPDSLIPSEGLRVLAGRAAGGTGSFEDFAAANGLAGVPTFFALVDGATPQNAVIRLKTAWCPQIRSPQFTHVGVAKVHGQWAVLLAGGEPRSVPVYTPGVPPQTMTPEQPAAQPAARPGVTPLYEAPPAEPAVSASAAVPAEEHPLPDIGHKEPLLTDPDGRPLPSEYDPPADTGVRIEPGSGAAGSDGPTIVGAGAEEPTIAAAEAAAAAVAEADSRGERPQDVYTKSPHSLETGDPAPAQPVPPIYSGNGVNTATDVERSGSSAGQQPQGVAGSGGEPDSDLLRHINEVRVRGYLCGRNFMPAVPALRDNPTVARAAAGHAADMRARGYFSPVTPEGRRAGNRLTDAGYAWAVLAENIASGVTAPEDALKNWLGNESQCRNIMSPDYTEAGAGRAGDIRVLTLTAPLSGGAMRAQ